MMKKVKIIMAVLVCVFLAGCDLAPVAASLSETSKTLDGASTILTVVEKALRPVAQESWRAYSNRHPVIRESVGLDGRVIKMISPQFPPEWYFGSKRITTPRPIPTPKPTPKPLPEPRSFADSENSYLFDDIWCEPSELVNNAYEAVYVDIVDVHVDTMDELVDETAECPGSEDGEGWDYYEKNLDYYF